jgi:hypothetical protein
MFSILRRKVASPSIVAVEIMPRSATTQTRPMENRRRNRSMTGSNVVTSAVLPGHILAADWTAGAVDHEAEDYLFQIRPVVLGIAVLAERLPSP